MHSSESEIDKINRLVSQYDDLERGRWSQLTRDDHLNLISICQKIKWHLGHEHDLWHRIMMDHSDEHGRKGDREARVRDRETGKSS